jgi:hypothetical protein
MQILRNVNKDGLIFNSEEQSSDSKLEDLLASMKDDERVLVTHWMHGQVSYACAFSKEDAGSAEASEHYQAMIAARKPRMISVLKTRTLTAIGR